MKISPWQKLKLLLNAFLFTCVLVPTFSFASGTILIDEFRTRYVTDTKDEYITVANYGSESINLAGYTLHKRTAGTTSKPELIHTFGDTLLTAGQRVTVKYSEYNGEESLADTGNLIIFSDNQTPQEIMDAVGYGKLEYANYKGTALATPAVGVAYKRIGISGDNSKDFALFVPVIPPDLNADKLVISELLPNPEDGEEWFELYNPTNLDVSLANLKICDVLGARHCYFFGKADTLPANSYKIYLQTQTKITLNNTGDWLELYDLSDNLLTDTGGNYGVADKGVSLALFGTDYQWTKSLTPAAQNIFTDTIEVEADTELPATKAKAKVSVAKKAVVSATATTVAADATPGVAVKAAETVKAPATVAGVPISRKTLGWALICLAILLVLGYTLWYFRSYAKDIYDKIRHGDDSARF